MTPDPVGPMDTATVPEGGSPMTCRCPGCLKGETCWRPAPQPTGVCWTCDWCEFPLNKRAHHTTCRVCGRDLERPKEDT